MQQITGYSADVRLALIVGEHCFNVGQVGPDDCILRDPIDLPPCEGELVVMIDGSERRWPVILVDGINQESPLVRYVGASATG
jgi:hypothetical protein